MNFKKLQILAIFCLTIQILKAAKRSRYTIVFNLFNCSSSEEVLKSICTINSVAGEREPQLTIEILLAQDFNKLRVHAVGKVLRPLPYKPLTIWDLDIDVCQLLVAQNNQLNVVHMAMKAIGKQNSLPKKCPLLKNTLYYFRNITFLDYLPALVPELDFRSELFFYAPSTLATFNMTLAGSLREARHRFSGFPQN